MENKLPILNKVKIIEAVEVEEYIKNNWIVIQNKDDKVVVGELIRYANMVPIPVYEKIIKA